MLSKFEDIFFKHSFLVNMFEKWIKLKDTLCIPSHRPTHPYKTFSTCKFFRCTSKEKVRLCRVTRSFPGHVTSIKKLHISKTLKMLIIFDWAPSQRLCHFFEFRYFSCFRALNRFFQFEKSIIDFPHDWLAFFLFNNLSVLNVDERAFFLFWSLKCSYLLIRNLWHHV